MSDIKNADEIGDTAAVTVKAWNLYPSPENDEIYDPINPNDPAFVELVASVRTRGVLEPVVATADGYLVSGHRRHAAAVAVGLDDVPCRYLQIRRDDDHDEFVRLLREHNLQRIKTFAERVREEIVGIDPADAYEHLKQYRRGKRDLSDSSLPTIEMGERRERSRITAAKAPMLLAVDRVIADLKAYWPLSVRQIHYPLLNLLPLVHASKPDSTYQNNHACYKSLCELLTRARVVGRIPWEAINDDTRTFEGWGTWKETGAFVGDQVGRFLKGYWRNLMASQENHIEIVGEKLTVKTAVERVAADFTIPVTIGRGFSGIDARYKLFQRFRASGKDKLVLIFFSDFDPDGESIAESFARWMCDDFGIARNRMHPVKAALGPDHVKRFNLPRSMFAKKTSSRFESFRKKHGDYAWELEALPMPVLEAELRKAIRSVIDLDAFDHERKCEAADARDLEAMRAAVIKSLPGLIGGAS